MEWIINDKTELKETFSAAIKIIVLTDSPKGLQKIDKRALETVKKHLLKGIEIIKTFLQ